MKVDSKNIVELEKVSRGIFVASFATFIFTSLFAISLANSGALSQNATASVASANSYNSNKLALITADDDDSVPGGPAVNKPATSDEPSTPNILDPIKPVISTVALSASLPKVPSGSQVRLTWKSENVSSCVLKKDGTTLSTYTASSGFLSGVLTKTAIFTLDCVGESGTVSKSVSVLVPEVAVTKVNISAIPTSVSYKGETIISWSAVNVKICKVLKNGILFSSKPNMTSIKSGPLTKETKFKIDCTGIEDKGASSEVLVSVEPAARPTVILSVETKETNATTPVDVKWSSTGSSKCVLMRGAVPLSRELNGNLAVKVTESTVIWATCSSEIGTAVDATAVTVK